MQDGTFPPGLDGSIYSERRKELRYAVALRGELRCKGAAFAVQIGELSGSGALLFLTGPPSKGTKAELWIEGFGVMPVKIMHAGQHFCGVIILNAAAHGDQLLAWLHQEVLTKERPTVIG